MAGELLNIHVLVVDDHDDARELVAMALEGAGAKVTQADSVPSAIAAVANDDFAVLVSDIGMPGEDGYALIRRVRAGETGTRAARIPAVAVTAFSAPEDRRKALSAGFQEHVAKPFEIAALVELVARLAHGTAPAQR